MEIGFWIGILTFWTLSTAASVGAGAWLATQLRHKEIRWRHEERRDQQNHQLSLRRATQTSPRMRRPAIASAPARIDLHEDENVPAGGFVMGDGEEDRFEPRTQELENDLELEDIDHDPDATVLS